MQITVVGSDHSLATAACLAELGHCVVYVAKDFAEVASLEAGRTFSCEPYLRELLARHNGTSLTFSLSLEGTVSNAEIVFIAAGGSCLSQRAPHLSSVESMARAVARCAEVCKVIVLTSTAPVYTHEAVESLMLMDGPAASKVDVVSNPLFLRRGSVVTDFLYPDRIIVGTNTACSAQVIRDMYAPLLNGTYAHRSDPIPPPQGARSEPFYLETSPQNAEIIKQASNAFLAIKISFMNIVAGICDAVGVDVDEVRQGISADQRIGADYLQPGIGYGGPAFAKSLGPARCIPRESEHHFSLLDEAHAINKRQLENFAGKVRSTLGTLANKQLAVWGLAYKGGTGEVQDSPAIAIVQDLVEEGAGVTVFDPAAMDQGRQVLGESVTYAQDAYSAAAGADALLVLTEWEEFMRADLPRLNKALRSPIVFDGRNLFSPIDMSDAGLTYYSVGRSHRKTSASLLATAIRSAS